MLHEGEVLEVFAYWAGISNAQIVVALLHWGAWPWTVAIGLVAITSTQRKTQRSIELLSIAALLIFAPPLLGFTLFFCGMYSARHVIRTLDYSHEGNLISLLRIAYWPMVITVAADTVAWWLFDEIPIDTRIAQLLFVGLASLTVPHMVVIEKVRLTGWIAGRRASR